MVNTPLLFLPFSLLNTVLKKYINYLLDLYGSQFTFSHPPPDLLFFCDRVIQTGPEFTL